MRPSHFDPDLCDQAHDYCLLGATNDELAEFSMCRRGPSTDGSPSVLSSAMLCSAVGSLPTRASHAPSSCPPPRDVVSFLVSFAFLLTP